MLAAALLLTLPAADPQPPRLGIFLAGAWLSSPGGHGGALGAGARLMLGDRLALGFDLGYGLISQSPAIQDRWWLMPSVALVVPAGPVSLDLGFGVGAATASAFTSIDALTHDQPAWANQLLPAVRGHVRAGHALSPGLDLFGRADFGGQLQHDAELGLSASTWAAVWLGLELRLF